MAEFRKSGGGFKSGGGRPGGFRPGGGDRPQFARKSGFGGAPRGGNDRNDRGGDRPVQMFAATCAECGKATEVPFRPNGQKPVFCRDCFALKRGSEESGNSRGDFNRRDDRTERPRSFEKREYTPQAPTQRAASPVEDKRIDELSRKVELIHKKLDTVMEMIEGMALAKGSEIQQVELAKTVKKVAAKKAVKAKK